MFGKKKQTSKIDPEQLKLIQDAQQRVKQKKRLYIHFILFLIGSIGFLVAQLIFKVGQDVKIFGIDWFAIAILLWLVLLLYHTFNVFITNRFMGKSWEESQMESLVSKQQKKIEKIKNKVEKTETENKTNPIATSKTSLSPETNSELTIIVAAAENNVIGKDNQLIWHLSDDLKRFKSLTSGHCIIMGRKTFESFPKPLPNRTHIVISRQADYKVPEGVIVVNNIKAAIDAAKHDKQPFIIGGGEIYRQAMDYADKIELTRVHTGFEGDTYFPEIDHNIWKETLNKYHDKDEVHKYPFSFITYERW
ncbi:dihydrofolate reductase [Mangrovimonas aestuarii]|uniref:dihydrofolate reductase n=1 Tax=Mangrovimonas aestuarii TaxID=3018443 RepID=UPI00237A03CE|nr:dihydrofolate reductase [Mangrovimonas aestuarii]